MLASSQGFKQKIQDGFLTVQSDDKEIRIPYLFVLEEPNYPRVIGFEIGVGDDALTYRSEVYLPGGAEEFDALFDMDTYQDSIPRVEERHWKRAYSTGDP